MELEKEWISRPVFRFDFSGAETAQDLELRLDNYLRRYEQVFGRDTWEQTLGDRLLSLLKRANEKTGCQVAVLVDEYDAPLQHSLFNDEEHKKLVSVYRGFFPALKEGELYVKCVFLTGITKFTQLSLFSTLNTVSILSLLPQYETLCGMTRQEIVDNYAPELDAMARKNGWGMEETLSALKNDYDGYYFSAERNEPVYNPFSLVNALDTGRISNYWASSGGSQMLTEMLSRQGANIMDLDNSLVDGDLMETSDVSVDNLPLFLYQCGYLTIKDYRDGVYYLGFPNGEVRRSLYKVILPIALSRSSSDVMSSISRMRVDLSSGDIEGAMLSLKELVAGTPYASKGEKSLEERYQFILVQAFYLCGFRIEQHRKVSKGEIDVVAYRGNLTLVMELKVGNGSRGIEKGEEQAYDRNYLVFILCFRQGCLFDRCVI